MQDMNNKVTSKDSLKSEGLDICPYIYHQHFETLPGDTVPLRSRIGNGFIGGRPPQTKGVRTSRKVQEWGHRGIESASLKQQSEQMKG